MKQGGTKVIPPIRDARLGKKGNVTDIENANPPNNRQKHVLNHLGHFLFSMVVYLSSKLSNTCIA